MKVYFHTLGCKVNRYETEYMLKQLQNRGFTQTEKAVDADLIVVNSCTVTAESDRKTRQLVRRYRRTNSNAIILLTGCMPQAFPSEASELPADIIIGNKSERDIVKSVEEFLKNHNQIIEVEPHKKGESFEKGGLDTFSERTRAYIKIQDGCDRGCTYCIIPKARGRVRSRSLLEIENEAQRLAQNGFKELVLVGINLSSFGKDTGYSLADAVSAASKSNGIKRVRLGSLEPDLTDDALLKELSKNAKFCPQFHLSLQSGCDETLKRMNRLYTSGFYKELVQKIRSIWKNASITTDIMVGFIGESDEEFEKSLKFAKDIEFLKAHIFPYSVREGTAAANMKGRVAEDIKSKRAGVMAKECDAVTDKILNSLIGDTRTVLFERSENEYTEGYSEDYIRVFVPKDDLLCGKLAEVKIVKIMQDGVLAKVI